MNIVLDTNSLIMSTDAFNAPADKYSQMMR